MASQAKTQLQIAVKATGVAGLSKLKSALQSVNNISKQSQVSFSKIGTELNKTNQTMVRSVNNVSKLKTSYEELARSVKFGSQQFKDATAQAKKLDKELAKMEKRRPPGGLGGVAKGLGAVAGAGVFGGAEGAIGALLGLPFGLAGAITGGAIGAQVGMLRKSIGEVASLRAEFRLMQVALAGVSDDLGDYRKGMAAVSEISQQFLIPQSDVIRQFVQLKASVRGAGFDTETTTKVFKGLAAAVLSTGGNIQDTNAALRAAAQVFSKGKVSAEELRQQIGERLPGAFTEFAASMGITSQMLDEALERGEVRLENFVVFTEDLIKIYEKNAETIASAPESAGRRLTVALNNMILAYGQMFTNIGSGFQTFLAKIVEFTNKNEEQIKNLSIEIIVSIEEIGRNLKEFVKGAVETLGPFFNFVLRAGGKVAEILSEVMPGGGDSESAKARDARLKQRKAELRKLFFEGFDPTTFGGTRDIDRGDLDIVDPTASGGKGRKDISFELREAKIAAMKEENEERKLALEFEVRLLQIRESDLKQNERAVELQAALTDLSKGRKRLEDERAKDIKRFYDSFKVKGGMFDMNAQAEQKTPFDMLRQGADEFTDSLKGTLEAAKELTQVGLRGISDGIVELVTNGTANFREFAASLLRDMARIIMQQVVMKALMQALGFGGGLDLSSFFVKNTGQKFKPISNVNVGSSGFNMPPLMAKGGITRGVSIAGEAGPEAVVPLPDGRSIPVTMQGEGTKVVVNVDAKGTSAQGDTGRANQLGEAIGAAVRQELLKQKRPGGLLA
jgi:tape measure domain-containing protein